MIRLQFFEHALNIWVIAARPEAISQIQDLFDCEPNTTKWDLFHGSDPRRKYFRPSRIDLRKEVLQDFSQPLRFLTNVGREQRNAVIKNNFTKSFLLFRIVQRKWSIGANPWFVEYW